MSEIQMDFWESKPFPCLITNNFFPIEQMVEIQSEILSLSPEDFDRYENPFEKKYTLRDKSKLPTETQKLFDFLVSESFLEMIYQQTGLKVENDPYKHYWGIHKFLNGDKLDIHVDAGIHPKCGKRKVLTFGLYLTKNYKEDYHGHFEMWSGDDAKPNQVCYLDEQVTKVPCYINHAILFACTDDSWHGAPTPYLGDEDSQRIFLTLSYIIDENDKTFKEVKEKYSPKFENTRTRAYFPAIRGVIEAEELSNLRLQRATESGVQAAYRTMA